MTRKNRRSLVVAASGLALMLALACSTDSPTAPTQEPIPPPGGTASAAWRITVSLDPNELTVGAEQPTTVTIRVVRADNSQPPATGTTIVVSTSLGEFQSIGSTLQSVALATANGFASTLLFAGDVTGTAFIVAQLEASTGQGALRVVEEIEPVVASFDFANSENDLSVQFRNTSTGDPTRFRWAFGDGTTSGEENPNHLYAASGDYVVTLTASKTGSSDDANLLVSVNDDLEASFEETVEDLTVVFRDTSTGNPSRWVWDFGDGRSSTEQNPTHVYRSEGSYVVTLTVRKSTRSSDFSKIITVTEEDVEAEDLFITDIDPEFGPATGDTKVRITGTGFIEPLRVFFAGVLAEPVGVNGTTEIVVRTPPGVLATVPCNLNADDTIGEQDADTAVTVTVELQSGTSETVSGGYTYTAVDLTCRGD